MEENISQDNNIEEFVSNESECVESGESEGVDSGESEDVDSGESEGVDSGESEGGESEVADIKQMEKILTSIKLSDLILLCYGENIQSLTNEFYSMELDETNEDDSLIIEKIKFLLEKEKEKYEYPDTYLIQFYRKNDGFYFVKKENKEKVLPKIEIFGEEVTLRYAMGFSAMKFQNIKSMKSDVTIEENMHTEIYELEKDLPFIKPGMKMVKINNKRSTYKTDEYLNIMIWCLWSEYPIMTKSEINDMKNFSEYIKNLTN